VPHGPLAGGESHEGRARVKYIEGSKEAPYSRTCARWYLLSPEVQEVTVWLHDYKRAALGPVQELEAPLLELLRHAEAEESRWMDKQTTQKRKG